MIPILSTRDMEAAVPLLAKYCERLIVRAYTQCVPKIRLRVRDIEVPMHYTTLHTGASSSDAVIPEQWTKQGGVLINFQRPEPEVSHDAKLFCECPLSLDDLHKWTRDTLMLAVVYCPPTWSPQEKRLEIRYPTAEVCRKFYGALKEEITDTELCHQLDLTPRELAGVRRGALQKSYWELRFQFIPRIEPEDKSLMEMYHAICQNQTPTKQELLKTATAWLKQIRRLVRCGSVARNPDIGFYNADMPEPNYERIERERALAEKKLEEIKCTVESVPELTASDLKVLCRSRQGQLLRSIARAPREAAARARDTTR